MFECFELGFPFATSIRDKNLIWEQKFAFTTGTAVHSTATKEQARGYARTSEGTLQYVGYWLL